MTEPVLPLPDVPLMIEDLLVYMLNMLSTGVGNGTDSLLQSPQEYNAALYNAALFAKRLAAQSPTPRVFSPCRRLR